MPYTKMTAKALKHNYTHKVSGTNILSIKYCNNCIPLLIFALHIIITKDFTFYDFILSTYQLYTFDFILFTIYYLLSTNYLSALYFILLTLY